WPLERPARPRRWLVAYGLSAAVLAVLAPLAVTCGLLAAAPAVRGTATLGEAAPRLLLAAVGGTALAYLVYAVLVLVMVRLLGRGLVEGYHPVRSRVGWQAWCTERLMDSA